MGLYIGDVYRVNALIMTMHFDNTSPAGTFQAIS
jgi:hypothetical protein